MESSRLDKDIISQPELWRLVILVSESALDVALYPPVVREEMIWRSFPYDSAATSQLKAIEDIVYDNPLLLCDFKQVDCIIDNTSRQILPNISDEDAEVLFIANQDESEGEIELYGTGFENARVALVQDAQIKAFFRRTFFNIRFDSRVAVLCRYLATNPGSESSQRLYAITRAHRLTLIVADGNRLLMANDFKFNTDADAAYYILASMQQLGLAQDAAEILISSSGVPANTLAEILRRYVASVKALPFPMLRYRATKSTLQAPIDLIIRPLCE